MKRFAIFYIIYIPFKKRAIFHILLILFDPAHFGILYDFIDLFRT